MDSPRGVRAAARPNRESATMTTVKTIGFMGGGRITRILLKSWQRSGRLPTGILVSDPNEAALASLAREIPGIETVPNGNRQAAERDVVFLAVHPPAALAVLDEIRQVPPLDAILVSLVPKLTIGKIKGVLGGDSRVVRMIPNAPAIVGAGYNPVVFSADISEDETAALLELFDAFGGCPQVPEKDLEAYAVISAMGPTYFWYQFQLLEELAGEFGILPGKANEAVTAMLTGAVKVLADPDLAPDAVRDLIPVKPLADLEPTVSETMRGKLTGLMAKLRV